MNVVESILKNNDFEYHSDVVRILQSIIDKGLEIRIPCTDLQIVINFDYADNEVILSFSNQFGEMVFPKLHNDGDPSFDERAEIMAYWLCSVLKDIHQYKDWR